MLRMSRDQVAPMKTPSIWKASTPLIAVKAAQGMKATVAARTSPAVVIDADQVAAEEQEDDGGAARTAQSPRRW